MSRKVFVDTAAWIALINRNDYLHLPAKEMLQELSEARDQLFSSEFVLLEVADSLAKINVRMQTIHYIEGLRQFQLLEIIPLSTELMNQAWQLYKKRDDKGWGLSDCSSFVIMEKLGIEHAFTSDQHFEQAGFITLL